MNIGDALNIAIGWAQNGHPKNNYRVRPNVFCEFCGTQHVYSKLLSEEDKAVNVCPKCFPEDI